VYKDDNNRLEGALNFNAWKARVLNILEENDLDDLVTRVVKESTTDQGRDALKKKQAKAKRVIYDSIKDNLMLVILSLRTTKECLDALINLYEKKAPIQKRTLKKQLRSLKMEKDESVASFSKISQIRYQLMAIGVEVDDDDLVQTVVDGLPGSWETFLASVNGREIQPNFERMWHDCLEEEGRIQSRIGSSTERDYSLAAKTKKGRRFPQCKDKGKTPQGKRLDLSKVRCFNCNQFGHFARDYRKPPNKKRQKDKYHASAAT